MSAHELNIDGIVGPTHNYAGQSHGNLASMNNAGRVSNPKAAALEGLQKMKCLADLGLAQFVAPPHDRPDISFLHTLGFRGSDADILEIVSREAPGLLAAASSASAMWMANAATVSPGPDTEDGRVHITPANLSAQLHRSIEPSTTARLLKAILPEGDHFVHHPPLPGAYHLADEGAANHTRLCTSYDADGIEVFVYGRSRQPGPSPEKYAARQTLEASRAIARRHRVRRAVFLQQNPDAIDRGVFHNDVLAVGDRSTLFLHEAAYLNTDDALNRIQSIAGRSENFRLIVIPEHDLGLDSAVETYLFNSQLVTLPDGKQTLIAPVECQHDKATKDIIDRTIDEGGFDRVEFVNVRESMRNGGGPACLRLRVVVNAEQGNAVHGGARLTPDLYEALTTWIDRHYRDRLAPDDLSDPSLLREGREALDDLTRLLDLGSVYPFQSVAD